MATEVVWRCCSLSIHKKNYIAHIFIIIRCLKQKKGIRKSNSGVTQRAAALTNDSNTNAAQLEVAAAEVAAELAAAETALGSRNRGRGNNSSSNQNNVDGDGDDDNEHTER